MKQETTPTQSSASESPPPTSVPKSEPRLSFPSVKPNARTTTKPKRKALEPASKPTGDSELNTGSGDEYDVKSVKKARKGTGSAGASATTMSPDIKEAMVDHIFRLGHAAMQKEDLAAQLGITKKQLVNATCSGRTNLRSKLIKAARDL